MGVLAPSRRRFACRLLVRAWTVAALSPIVNVVHLRDKPGTYFVRCRYQRPDRPTLVGGIVEMPVSPRSPSLTYSKTRELLQLAERDVRVGQ